MVSDAITSVSQGVVSTQMERVRNDSTPVPQPPEPPPQQQPSPPVESDRGTNVDTTT